MKYKGLAIADVHIKALPIKKLYDEYKSIFISQIENDDIDYVVICGDWFHCKFFLNDEESTYAYKMIGDIIIAARNRNHPIKIRIVYGTKSHEEDQYDIIENMLYSDPNMRMVDIKVIKHVCEEELFPDMHVLYVPEEHIMDKKEYYKEYFKNEKKYDYVFGHGVIREAMKEAATQMEMNKDKRRKVPVCSTAEFHKICRGQTFFGHYHVHSDMDDVFYIGSFSRWQYGEDEAKGFYKLTYNTEKEKYKAEFIENTMADTYQTIRFGYENKIFSSQDELDKKLSTVDDMIKNQVFDHVRFEFNLPEDIEQPESVINYVNERYRLNNKVKVNFVHGYIDKKKQKQKDEIAKETSKYEFIFDKEMELEHKTSLFIQIEYEKTIPPERVGLYLYKPLNVILKELEKVVDEE